MMLNQSIDQFTNSPIPLPVALPGAKASKWLLLHSAPLLGLLEVSLWEEVGSSLPPGKDPKTSNGASEVGTGCFASVDLDLLYHLEKPNMNDRIEYGSTSSNPSWAGCSPHPALPQPGKLPSCPKALTSILSSYLGDWCWINTETLIMCLTALL